MSHEQPEVTEEVKSTPGIWELAWPAILSNLLFSVIGVVTIKIVGTLGAEAVAAVTTGHRIFWGLQATLMAISAGTTALVARSWGADDPAEAARVTTVSLWLSNAVAIGLMLPCSVWYLFVIIWNLTCYDVVHSKKWHAADTGKEKSIHKLISQMFWIRVCPLIIYGFTCVCSVVYSCVIRNAIKNR